MADIRKRFVVVGSMNEGTGEITRYDDSESRLATAIYRANLEDAEKICKPETKSKIVFGDIEATKKANDDMIRNIFGNVE